MKKILLSLLVLLSAVPLTAMAETSGTTIDRKALFTRNNPVVTKADTLASLSVGNGRFATTVDFTGLQSYPDFYRKGVPLCAMSEWGWHSFPNTEGLTHSETLKGMDLGHGRVEKYAIEYKDGSRNQEATKYFRVNPHRLNLGTVGLLIKDNNGKKLSPLEASDIRQTLNLWDGVISSSFSALGRKVEVTSAALPDRDCFFASVKSPLLKEGKACIDISFPYPTGIHSDDASDYSKPQLHSSTIESETPGHVVIRRELDSTVYYAVLSWEGEATFARQDSHDFTLSSPSGELRFSVEYLPELPARFNPFSFSNDLHLTADYWHEYWRNGAVADFSLCTDPRARELERRVVLSQYLTAINCASQYPPQETGLTYNSWFGRPHLEMTWWHAVDFALWDRPEVLAKMLEWYDKAYPEARKIAARQGFKGVRWMKMTDPEVGEAPSNVGSYLIWQQPHYIYMAEEIWRADPTPSTLSKYADKVEATAEFMADYALACDTLPGHSEIPLFGQTAMQECQSKNISYNHPFELAYWRYGLLKAQEWRERAGLPRHKEWDDIISRLSPLPEADGIYQPGIPVKGEEEKFSSVTHNDHPAVLGACGMLPDMNHYDPEIMKRTLLDVFSRWNWSTTWGWDYGMTAMCAARLGMPEKAIEALLIDKGKNTYLVSGHNFQEPVRLRLYLPGNGSLLDAVAMMCAGWDGSTGKNPGFPNNGKWDVRWEGLKPMQ